jgi:glucokinase-like ROK family protein
MSINLWTVPSINTRNWNRHAAVDLIRFTPGGISRVEISRQLQLTRAAITEIINDLQALGIVRELDAPHSSGRHSIGLEINPDLGKVIGIDLGATHATLLLSDFSAHVLADREISLNINDGPERILPVVEAQIQQLLNESGLAISDIRAVGVGVPGPVISAAGTVGSPPIMRGWDRYPIYNRFVNFFGCPVSLNNDAELGALGEWAYGAGRGEHNLVYVKVGTGIGSGLLLEGQIYRGATGSAGEIGHITIQENGPECSCGNRGCLEALAGGRAIAQRACEAVQSGQRTQLAAIPPQAIQARDVINAARSGDLLAQTLVTEAGAHLGTAIASLVNLFNPSMVIVGGSVSQIGDLFLEPVRRTVQQRSLAAASRAARISTALLGRRSSGMGAVVQALSLALHQMPEKE